VQQDRSVVGVLEPCSELGELQLGPGEKNLGERADQCDDHQPIDSSPGLLETVLDWGWTKEAPEPDHDCLYWSAKGFVDHGLHLVTGQSDRSQGYCAMPESQYDRENPYRPLDQMVPIE
jgi:hypothetical protein